MSQEEERPKARPLAYVMRDINNMQTTEDFVRLGKEFNEALPVFMEQVAEASRPVLQSLDEGYRRLGQEIRRNKSGC